MKTLRAYQQRFVESAQSANCILLLPTGAGKTLIAAESLRRIGPPAVFFVPTCLLTAQQATAIREWTKFRVVEYMGGMKIPTAFDVLVTTPNAFEIAQALGHTASFQWSHFRAVIFDEVHHMLKSHPYRKLAFSLKSSKCKPRVLGLSASLTYAVDAAQVKTSVQRMCKELGVTKVVTCSTQELIDGGYHGSRAEAEYIPLVAEGIPGLLPAAQRRSRSFFDRVLVGKVTGFSTRLLTVVVTLERSIKQWYPNFCSPLSDQSNMKEWGVYAHTACPPLEHWYEALRIQVGTYEEGEDAAATYLRMMGQDSMSLAAPWPAEVQAPWLAFWGDVPKTFPRFEHLKSVLMKKYGERGDAFRGIVFVEQRLMTHILEYVIRSDPALSAVLRPACLYASSSPATASFRVSASAAKQRLGEFAAGRVNLMIATVVAEEGMDIPAANCVIRFDPMNNMVSFVQGRGRARQKDSSFVILAQRADRPATLFAEVEHQQHELMMSFDPTGSNR